MARESSKQLVRRLVVCIIHTMRSADLIRELKEAGWVLKRIRGSHHVFTHRQRRGIVVVPHPKHELGVGLVAAIRKQAGI
jgi:predicted RNA binding protein YcfA (HicA-like mRNA interferase family)